MSIMELIPWKREAELGLSPAWDFENAFDLLGPDLRVRETDKAYEVTMKLPGIEKKNVRVDVRGDRVTIHAEQKEERRSRRGFSSSRRSFDRSFTLPAGVKGKDAKADFKDGELHIELPKSDPAHKVEVR